MTNVPIVKSLDASAPRQYDLLLCALGYESRARFIAQSHDLRARHKMALGFTVQRVLRYDENKSWFERAEFEIIELEEKGIQSRVRSACDRLLAEGRRLRVCCDISSMSRHRIALIVDILRSLGPNTVVSVDFLYAIAEYTNPPTPLLANTHVGPVTPSFAGWTTEPELPVSAIVGLGYEPDKALGAVEHLQASEIWALEPLSHIPEYTEALLKANRTLLDFVPSRFRLEYRVERPYTLFSTLRDLTFSCLRSSNPVILPFGPKIFTLASLLVACVSPDVAVWRVSAGAHEPPVDRRADGFVTGLTAEFMPS